MTQFVSRGRRWTRFSVRTLLVVIALFSIWLGSEVNRARRQRDALNVVQQLGGFVNFDYQAGEEHVMVTKESPKDRYVNWQGPFWVAGPDIKPHGPVFLHSLLGDEFFQNIENVGLSLTAASDSDLATLARIRSLQSIELQGTKITDKGLNHLSGLRSLRSLDLSGTLVSDDGLRHLSEHSELELLRLSGCTRLTVKALSHLHKLPNLKVLILGKGSIVSDGRRRSFPATPITDEGIQFLKHFSSLEVLQVVGTPLTEEAVKELGEMLPHTSIVR
ncbi:hypothetical protein ACFL2H_02960 [Planctomycetota bacterium]